jgi:hypothetical protein
MTKYLIVLLALSFASSAYAQPRCGGDYKCDGREISTPAKSGGSSSGGSSGGDTGGDDDGDNGHGNDDDHDDDSNPGKGGGNHGTKDKGKK